MYIVKMVFTKQLPVNGKQETMLPIFKGCKGNNTLGIFNSHFFYKKRCKSKILF